MANTPARLMYNALDVVPKERDSFYQSFRVRTCADASIMILPETTIESEYYEVVIGTNSNSEWVIKRGGFVRKVAMYPNSLSAEKARSFWVNWHKGNLTAGVGELGQYHVIAYQDPTPVKMFGMAFSTQTSCDGDWSIDQRIGK